MTVRRVATETASALVEPLRVASERVRVPKAAELVAAEVRRKIVRGTLKEGTLLPPEGVLLRQFGASRPTLREALRVLESEGLITIQRGARGGCRVQAPSLRVAARNVGLLLQSRGGTLGDVFRARQVIEPAAAGMVAERPTKATIQALEKVLRMEEATLADERSLNLLPDIFIEFHERVVELSGSKTLTLFVGMVHDIVALHYQAVARGMFSKSMPQAAKGGAAEHRAHLHLLEHVKAGNPIAAEAHWRAHLEAAGRYLLPGLEGKALIELFGQ